MKNLKKLNRENLRLINGGAVNGECMVDLDCGPAGCAVCVAVPSKNRNLCLYFSDPRACTGTNSL